MSRSTRKCALRPGHRTAGKRATQIRHGVAAVEFALVAPVFIILIFGIMEMGRAFMVQQIITNASREGARRAIVEQATTTDVTNLVDNYLGATSVSQGYSVNVAPAIGPSLGFGDPVTVTVTVPYSAVSWIPNPWWMGSAQLSATSIMRVERPQ